MLVEVPRNDATKIGVQAGLEGGEFRGHSAEWRVKRAVRHPPLLQLAAGAGAAVSAWGDGAAAGAGCGRVRAGGAGRSGRCGGLAGVAGDLALWPKVMPFFTCLGTKTTVDPAPADMLSALASMARARVDLIQGPAMKGFYQIDLRALVQGKSLTAAAGLFTHPSALRDTAGRMPLFRAGWPRGWRMSNGLTTPFKAAVRWARQGAPPRSRGLVVVGADIDPDHLPPSAAVRVNWPNRACFGAIWLG